MGDFCIVIKSPVKYDMPYSADMYGRKGVEIKRKKSKIEKILEKAVKSVRERD